MSSFTVNRKWAEEICQRVAGLGVRWISAARVGLADRGLPSLIKESGCTVLGFAVESGTDGMLATPTRGKGMTLSQVRQVYAWARELQLPTFVLFMTRVGRETPGSPRDNATPRL